MNGDAGRVWTIQEVVRMSGVSSRTLRHYDDVGLLPPNGTTASGTRLYGIAQLRRLQRILLMRELGLGLDRIAVVLAEQEDEITVLRAHRDQLEQQRERLAAISRSVQGAIDDLEAGREMKAEELFEGFDPQQQASYERELVDQFESQAKAHIDQSWRKIAAMDREDGTAINAAFAAVDQALAALLADDVPTDDARVQEQIAGHYAIVARFWTPTADAYVGLGQLYVDHPDFRARYDAVNPALAEYLRDAMTAYARAELAD